MIARNREEGSKSVYIGAACYPTLAMFNHSCDPSIIRYDYEACTKVQLQFHEIFTTKIKYIELIYYYS